jgi:hypothetical protein
MVILRADSLAPPLELIKGSDSIVVVSSKRPVCVYFNKIIDIASSRVFSAAKGSVVEVKLTGAGGAISRCEQVARYTVQALKSKYKHLVTSVEKEITRDETETTDVVFPEGDLSDEAAVLDVTSERRQVRTVTITLKILVA